MSDPLGGDVFDVESLAEAEIEKLLKQVCNKCCCFHFKTHSGYSWHFFCASYSSQYRTIEAERLNFIDVKEKTSRKYNKLLKILEKEKSDLQYQLESEQKGIHARRDSDVHFLPSFKLFPQLKFPFSFHTKKSFKWTLLLPFSSLF